MQTARPPRLRPLRIPEGEYVNVGNASRRELALMKTELDGMHGQNIDPDESLRVTRSGRSTAFLNSLLIDSYTNAVCKPAQTKYNASYTKSHYSHDGWS